MKRKPIQQYINGMQIKYEYPFNEKGADDFNFKTCSCLIQQNISWRNQTFIQKIITTNTHELHLIRLET